MKRVQVVYNEKCIVEFNPALMNLPSEASLKPPEPPKVVISTNPESLENNISKKSTKKWESADGLGWGEIPMNHKFHDLTVIGIEEPRINSQGRKIQVVRCKCICGNIRICFWHNVKYGHSKSCGCHRKKFPTKKVRPDGKVVHEVVPGQRRNYLTAIKEAPPIMGARGVMKRQVECRCACGNIVCYDWSVFRRGDPLSCGCKKFPGE